MRALLLPIILFIAALIIVIAGSYFYFVYDPEPKEPPPETATVTEAIDGLTARIDTGHRIRYIGSYLPSPDNCFGDKALEGNVNLIGKKIRLEIEPLLERSADGAWVRYVWVMPETPEDELTTSELTTSDVISGTSDVPAPVIASPEEQSVIASPEGEAIPRNDEPKEILINEKILEMGLGFALVSEDMKYGQRMLSAARYAQATGRGMWSQCEIVEGKNGRADTKNKERVEERPADTREN